MNDDTQDAGPALAPTAPVTPVAASDAGPSAEPRSAVTPEPAPPAAQEPPRRSGSFLRELPFLVAIALVLALVIKAFLVQAFFIPSGSMENTLRVGDRVLVNKLIYRFRDIHRGEIVVFNGDNTSFQPEVSYKPPSNPVQRVLRSFGSAIGVAPPGEKDFIKRVIGVGGDHVQCCDSQGRVSVNGVPLNEPYLYPGNRPSDTPFDVTVPAHHLWVMGDHRGASQDSRAYITAPGGGFIPESKVIGRAFVIVWPIGHVGRLPVPQTFQQKAVGAAPPVLAGVAVVSFAGLRRRRHRRGRHRVAA